MRSASRFGFVARANAFGEVAQGCEGMRERRKPERIVEQIKRLRWGLVTVDVVKAVVYKRQVQIGAVQMARSSAYDNMWVADPGILPKGPP